VGAAYSVTVSLLSSSRGLKQLVECRPVPIEVNWHADHLLLDVQYSLFKITAGGTKYHWF